MFRTLLPMEEEQIRMVNITVNEQTVSAKADENLAVALLKANLVPFRHTPVGHSPRAPLCLMGVCFDCLVEVDGAQNIQSCMVHVCDGMRIRSPQGARSVGMSK